MQAGKLEELQALNEVIAKRANQRFKELEKHGMNKTAAYNTAKYYLQTESELSGGETFSRKKIEDIDALGEDLKQASKFLRSQTSTVSGETKRRKKIYKSLTTNREVKENGKTVMKKATLHIPESIKVPDDYSGEPADYFKEKFLDFLDNDVWKDIKKYIYAEDTQVLNEAGEAIARGAQIEGLEEAFEQYLEGETDIFTVWDNWIKVDK